jgi:hypothetical protein
VQGIGYKDVTTTKQPDGLTLVLSAASFLEASLQLITVKMLGKNNGGEIE